MTSQLGTTFLELINEGRGYLGADDLTFEDISLNKSVAADALAAANKAWKQIRGHSSDLQFAFTVNDIDLYQDTDILRIQDLTDKADLDLVKWIKVKFEGDTKYTTLTEVLEEELEEFKGYEVSTGKPKYYSIYSGQINVVPQADQDYTLRIGYQKEYSKIDETNVSEVVPFSAKWELVFTMGVEAFLKNKYTRPDAKECERAFLSQLTSTARYMNKHSKKKKTNYYKVRSRRVRRAF